MKINIIKSKFLDGRFDQNTYVLEKGNNVLIIDAGAEILDVKNVVKDKNVLGVLFTHLHFDHTWNIEEYLEAFNCNLFIQKNEEDRFVDSNKNASRLIRQNIMHKIPNECIKYYENKFKLGDFLIEKIDTPGHTKDSVCLLIERNLFCGDTLFFNGIGRTDLIDSSNEDMIESLNKIKLLDYDLAYSGHGKSFSKEHADNEINYYL